MVQLRRILIDVQLALNDRLILSLSPDALLQWYNYLRNILKKKQVHEELHISSHKQMFNS